MEKNKKKTHKGRIALVVVAVTLAVLLGAFFIYTGMYYPAEQAALDGTPETVMVEDREGYIACVPQGKTPEVGYVFYPGAKVDEKAYLPYLAQVARQGYLCAVVKAPFHLAFFGAGAADTVKQDWPEVTVWVVGGHSLGGVVASGYAADGGADGLVLLASYPSVDLSGSGLPVLSITGTQDQVLNRESYAAAAQKLPEDTEYMVIEGGNHSGFGAYGHQKGDGAATVAPEEQRQIVAEATARFLAQCAAVA